MLKKCAIALTILLVGVLAYIYVQGVRKDGELAKLNAQRQAEAHELEVQKWTLTDELNGLEDEYGARIRGEAMIQLLCLSADERLYMELYPQMKAAGLSGVIGLSATELPGREGKITKAQFDEMIADGWTTCALWNGGDYLPYWCSALERTLTAEEIPMPKAVYFPSGKFSEEYAEALIESGLTTAIHHGEDERPLITEEKDGEIWNVGAQAWNIKKFSKTLSQLQNRGGNLVLTIDLFSEETEAEEAEEEEPGTPEEHPLAQIEFESSVDFGVNTAPAETSESENAYQPIDIDELLVTLTTENKEDEPEEERQIDTTRYYEQEAFEKWAQLVTPLVESGKLRLTGFEQAYAYREGIDKDISALLAEKEQRYQTLSEQVQELDKQIQAIYKN